MPQILSQEMFSPILKDTVKQDKHYLKEDLYLLDYLITLISQSQGDYEAMLLSLPEHQRKQLLEGDWDIKEGAAFTEFDRNIHVIEPFDIPRNWVKFRSCDYGYGSYSAVLWFAVSPDEQTYCI